MGTAVQAADSPGSRGHIPVAGPASVGVIGAGSIGVAWSLEFARAGHEVRLFDPDARRRDQAPEELASRLAALTDAGLLTGGADVIGARVSICGDLGCAVAGASYEQECAPQTLPLKREH